MITRYRSVVAPEHVEAALRVSGMTSCAETSFPTRSTTIAGRANGFRG